MFVKYLNLDVKKNPEEKERFKLNRWFQSGKNISEALLWFQGFYSDVWKDSRSFVMSSGTLFKCMKASFYRADFQKLSMCWLTKRFDQAFISAKPFKHSAKLSIV